VGLLGQDSDQWRNMICIIFLSVISTCASNLQQGVHLGIVLDMINDLATEILCISPENESFLYPASREQNKHPLLQEHFG
jgi:hypothetical protein